MFQRSQLTYLNPRLKTAWILASAEAKREASAVEVTWNPSGQSFSFTYRNRTKTIYLSQLKSAAINSCDELLTHLQQLLPPTVDFSKFSLDKIAGFRGTSLSKSVVDDTENRKIFQEYVDVVWEAISQKAGNAECKKKNLISLKNNSGIWNKKRVEKYLGISQNLQDAALVAFHASIGIPPRPWQTSALSYRPFGQPKPNINVLHGQVIVSNPIAKQIDLKEYSAIWALPPQLGRVLVFYLGVIREIEVNLLSQVFKWPTEEHKVYIFTRLSKKTAASSVFSYSTSQINQILVASELGLDPLALRHVMIALFRRQYPLLLQPEPAGASSVDEQAQHLRLTGDIHYSPDEVIRSTGQSITRTGRQMLVSQTLQAQYGMIEPIGTTIDLGEHRLHALYQARHQILLGGSGYGIVILQEEGWKARSKRVEDLLERMPFMYGPKVCPGIKFISRTTGFNSLNCLLGVGGRRSLGNPWR